MVDGSARRTVTLTGTLSLTVIKSDKLVSCVAHHLVATVRKAGVYGVQVHPDHRNTESEITDIRDNRYSGESEGLRSPHGACFVFRPRSSNTYRFAKSAVTRVSPLPALCLPF